MWQCCVAAPCRFGELSRRICSSNGIASGGSPVEDRQWRIASGGSPVEDRQWRIASGGSPVEAVTYAVDLAVDNCSYICHLHLHDAAWMNLG